jgi:uncharacterized protein with HEPN domain
MTRRRAPKLLRDAYSACEELIEFTAGKSFDDYQSDRGLQLIVERLLEILGEALNLAWQDDPTLDDEIPDRREIVGMRNQIIHGYWGVKDQVLWDTVQTDIPALRDRLREVLETRGWI